MTSASDLLTGFGGEVSLLAPEDHAAALLVMPRQGREPMSMTHGDSLMWVAAECPDRAVKPM